MTQAPIAGQNRKPPSVRHAFNRALLNLAAAFALGGPVALLPGCASNSPSAGPPVVITSFGPNAVSVWDEIATNAVNTAAAPSGTPEERLPLPGIDQATVHLAIYDALMAITGLYQAYAIKPSTPAAGASMEAAANAAAYGVMRGLFPARANLYQRTFDTRMAAVPDDDAKARGIAVGTEVARGVLALRANDGRHTPLAAYVPGTAPGKFRGANPTGRALAYVKPFSMTSAAQFRAGGPPALDSSAYAADFNETRTYGAAVNSARNAAQTESARFYTEPPSPYYSRNFRQFASSQPGLADNARLMALISVARADATISCFESKYHFDFWRPVSAIRLADSRTNPATVADAGWTAVVPAPNFPEYPAAHSCITTAAAEALRLYFRTDQVSVSFDSRVSDTVVHRFTTTDGMSDDAAAARIYGGMHFRTATVDGTTLGKQVARWVSERHFRPRN